MKTHNKTVVDTICHFCKKDYDVCITQAQKIKELEPRSWISLLFSLNEKNNEINLKE